MKAIADAPEQEPRFLQEWRDALDDLDRDLLVMGTAGLGAHVAVGAPDGPITQEQSLFVARADEVLEVGGVVLAKRSDADTLSRKRLSIRWLSS
jgi:hypothetical protein